MHDACAVRLSWAQVSETGSRASNQDAIGAARNGDLACFAIADGTGGHRGGEVASRIAVDSLIRAFCDGPAFGTQALLGYVDQAIGQVEQARRGDPDLSDMSTTIATLLVDQHSARAVWAHLGDSRIYLFRAGRVLAVTRDHSLAQQLVDAGYIDAAQLREHPQRNILLAAAGAQGEIGVAASGDPVALMPGDALLACSDGLWEWVREEEMEQALLETGRSEDWLAAMCATADAAVKAAGKARDNYSAYAIRVHHQEPAA
ncbi:protein phosphatase 2C domain-containing protein [Massilia sp. R2A-15]|uniref:PP2C family protein-serine/threonine phosphatase n=1 Tax=Massilia sp. R2A-15 TaxID=3064278 RepID=UPI0027362DFE|nr:protein phosphatase 2C domain-containing protein [Massilia sp. R2A-15]WLI91695.1 protein phosphatase 2C domain-containing protein [Massilia sp. R2A-15]